MAAIDWSDVTAHAADLSTVGATAQTDILAFVNEQIAVARFGGEDSAKLRLVRIYYAAHLGELWRRENDATADDGEVQSETISATSMTVTYMRQQTAPNSLAETSHGRKAQALMRAARVGLIPGVS